MRFTPHTFSVLRPVLALTALLSLNAHAARPMITDDARIVDAKACQVESWVKGNKSSTEYWAIPACNFTGNLEVSIGGSAINQNGQTQNQSYVLQGKTLFKTL